MMRGAAKRSRKSMRSARSLLRPFLIVLFIHFLCICAPELFAAEGQGPAGAAAEEAVLQQATICEVVKDSSPVNSGVVFSSEIGKVFCHTSFAPANRKGVIFHCWYHNGQLSNKQRLAVNAPEFAASSSMQLREADKGPWQVEIVDAAGKILRVLRFSVVD